MMKELNRSSVTIIGTGAVGTVLLDFFRREQFIIKSLWNSGSGMIYRDPGGELTHVNRDLPKSEDETGDLIFITTPDDRIREVSRKLSSLAINWSDKRVVHCSGNFTSDELSFLVEKGARAVSMHPVQTFKQGDGAERLKGISISLEGDEALASELISLIKQMGSRPVSLNKQQKRALHIGAVFASNYLVSLFHKTQSYLEEEGLEDGLEILKPLIHQTLTNIMEKGASEALTGPVSRGDVSSILKHLDALGGKKDTRQLYKLLGLEAVKITRKRGALDENVLKKTESLFRE
jgi:predicted short-subunit dehydrogenase-like oxidoreductase (DUF2520 family)